VEQKKDAQSCRCSEALQVADAFDIVQSSQLTQKLSKEWIRNNLNKRGVEICRVSFLQAIFNSLIRA